MKSVHRVISGPHFLVFGINMEIYNLSGKGRVAIINHQKMQAPTTKKALKYYI